jgi:hypothetical protein
LAGDDCSLYDDTGVIALMAKAALCGIGNGLS